MRELQEAMDILANKGYYAYNMIYDNTSYELHDITGKVVIDCLSESQVIALSTLL